VSLSRLITEQLSQVGRRGVVVERAPNLVVLLDSDRTEHGVNLANAIWKAGSQQSHPVSVGIGRAVENLDRLPESYEQALEALDIGMVFQPKEGGIVSFDTLGVLYWLRICRPKCGRGIHSTRRSSFC